MREPVSEGIFRTRTLDYIRFFWPFYQIAFKNLLVDKVLAVFKDSTVFHSLLFFSDAFMHFLVLASDLFARPGWEVGADESKVGTIQLEKLF